MSRCLIDLKNKIKLALLFGIAFALFPIHSQAITLPSWCPKLFSKLKTSGLPTELAAAKRDFPSIQNIQEMEMIAKKRRAEWIKTHPSNPDGYPMPEHKPGIDWLKSAINDSKENPYFNYRDSFQKQAEEAWRNRKRELILKRISELESLNYPHRQSIELAEEAMFFFSSIDTVRSPDVYLSLIKRSNPELARESISEQNLNRLHSLWESANNAVGSTRRSLQIQYENEFFKAISETGLPENKLRMDLRQSLINQFEDELKAMKMGSEDDMLNNLDAGAFILTPNETSVRGLLEASLFNVHPGGLTNFPAFVDGETLHPAFFLGHDRGHYAIANWQDGYAKKVMKLPAEKKYEILRRVDLIVDPREKELAEFIVLAATRELLGTQLREKTSDAIRSLQRKYKVVSGKELSEAEARWSLKWAKENIPVKRGFFR